MLTVQSIQLNNLRSLPSATPVVEPRPLNVLIGPDGAGKSSFIEAFDLVTATPLDLATFILIGGGVEAWPRKGPDGSSQAHASELAHQAGTK